MGINLHQDLINKNHEYWTNKLLLRLVYKDFYRMIAQNLSGLSGSKVVELGSGLGNIHEVIPDCIRTDLFPYSWIDQIENAYQLSFKDESVSDLILTDVFHHLQYPGTALNELYRVLRKGGHVIMLEPCISLLGAVVYGIFHQEPIAVTKKIEWFSPDGWSPDQINYYAAQGNATRIFLGNKYVPQLQVWNKVRPIRISAFAYAASGGYSVAQLYPTHMLSLIRSFEKILDLFPALFATRLLVILEK
jgi:SAM-dependent methyltransferase